jgi:transcriptional regulator with XRE-family HTH domain
MSTRKPGVKKIVTQSGVRMTKFDPVRHPPLFLLMASQGKTRQDIAEYCEVSRQTLWHWEQDFPAAKAAIELGIEQRTDAVERSLHQRACGYEYPSEKIVVVEGEVQRVPIVEKVAPDVTAATFWLKNRRPELWADRSEVVTGDLAARLSAARLRLRAESLSSQQNLPTPQEPEKLNDESVNAK